MCEKLSYIIVNTKTRRHKGIKFLCIKYYVVSLCFCVFVSFFCSCDRIILDVEGKDADLQGKWQMDNVDTVYYNFQKNLFQYQIYRQKGTISATYGYYMLHGDTAIDIQLIKPSSFFLNYLEWDAMGNDTIHKLFKIEQLTSKKMILSSGNENISFHKF